MKIRVTTPLRGFAGKALRQLVQASADTPAEDIIPAPLDPDTRQPSGPPMVLEVIDLREVLLKVCGRSIEGDEKLTAKRMNEVAQIGFRAAQSDVIDLSLEEVAQLQNRIHKIYGPELLWASTNVLESPEPAAPAEA